VDRYRFDARGFKRCSARTCSRSRAEYDTASGPLPQYEQWLLGAPACAASSSGAYIGDRRFLWSAELRAPFSSPLSAGRVGFNVFMDGGAVRRTAGKLFQPISRATRAPARACS